MEKKLRSLWKQYEEKVEKKEAKEILKRGFCFSNISNQYDILVTGFNPSYRKNDKEKDNHISEFIYQDIIEGGEDKYFMSINNLFDNELKKKVTYIDLFNYRETSQKAIAYFLKKNYEEGIAFITQNLRINQELIETKIRPKLIIVKNKGSWNFWGKKATKEGNIWMGYDLEEKIKEYPCGEAYRINGLIDSEQRVSADTLSKSNLIGSIILFTQHFQYCPKEKRPNQETIKELYELAD